MKDILIDMIRNYKPRRDKKRVRVMFSLWLKDEEIQHDPNYQAALKHVSLDELKEFEGKYKM